MKFSEQWLGEWLDGQVDSAHLHDRLTMSGLEVDGVEPAAMDFSGVVVAEVLSVAPHHDAEKLNVCTVDVGSETLQIVCGAANVRAEAKFPLATIGAFLPGEFKIKKSKLRGVESFGMLCSTQELGITDEADGLMELPASFTVGEDLRQAMSLDDSIIEVSLTPNRGDCLSILGIARDVAVFCDVPFKPLEMRTVNVKSDQQRSVHLETPEACPKYIGRVISKVNVNADTPFWVQEKLRRSGLRSISPVVDITNYVMLEMGLPMHAFDNDLLTGAIHVRYAHEQETLTLLDEQAIELDSKTLVIADDDKVLALAGIMGGLDSSVTEQTQNIFLECAFFTPEEIIGDARKYGLHTDSSHRFERGVDYDRQLAVIERASELITTICGGEAGPITESVLEEHLPKRSPVELRKPQIQRLLGMELADEKIVSIFQRLGLDVKATANGWSVTPPSYRFDITIEADLIEELARVIGYDNIAVQPLMTSLSLRPESSARMSLEKIRHLLEARGYYEVITYSFIDPKIEALFADENTPLALANPISSELSVMRSSLLPGLLNTLQYNVNRQQSRVRLFESGLVFEQSKELEQTPRLAGLVYGEIEPQQWGTASAASDFFDMKNDVEAVLGLSHSNETVKFIPFEQKSLHPHQACQIIINGQRIGIMGAVHPETLQSLGIAKSCYIFELDLAAICGEKAIKFSELSKFPSVRRDLSILVDESLAINKISDSIQNSAQELLKNLELFSVYQGEGIEIGKKSLTYGLTFQRSSSTLVDTEVDANMEDILAALENEFGATLRE